MAEEQVALARSRLWGSGVALGKHRPSVFSETCLCSSSPREINETVFLHHGWSWIRVHEEPMRFCVLGRPCLKVCLDSDSICWFTLLWRTKTKRHEILLGYSQLLWNRTWIWKHIVGLETYFIWL